ncbi:hypothetical protein ACRPK8_01710 [Exiguobacterium sp. TDN 0502]|uniref:hypothetical protein n=1 Tax=Exiguobacterium sp. TDN 0502 TaxID=3420731 RepID=UPI003D778452
MSKVNNHLLVSCHENDSNRQKKMRKFGKYISELNSISFKEKRYFYITLSIFNSFITPPNNIKFKTDSIPKLKEDSIKNIRKIFKIRTKEVELIHKEHSRFLDIFDNLYKLNYEDFKLFRSIYLETIIYLISDKVILPQSNEDDTFKYMEPEIKIVDSSIRNNWRNVSSLENDIDVGILNRSKETNNVSCFKLIECKSSLNVFAKTLVGHISQHFEHGVVPPIPELNKVSFMIDVKNSLTGIAPNLKFLFATYDFRANIKYLEFSKQQPSYHLDFMFNEIEIIDFYSLIDLLDAA